MRRDGDPPALPHTHALQAAVHPGDEAAQTHLADEGLASVMTADPEKETNKKKEREREGGKHALI